jgi:acetoin utilization deacetylase AcuC-like enzyme
VRRMMMIEQRRGDGADRQAWVLDEEGRRMPGHDHTRRSEELRAGLECHERVRSEPADATCEEVEHVLGMVHEPAYLAALKEVASVEPVLIAGFAAPGMTVDTPVSVPIAADAYEGVRTAVTAAQRIVAGERYAYALCFPPGHHAGPSWLGGSCYLNNAAAAAQILKDGAIGPVGILDLDIHYPNGTSAIAERMSTTSLYSLHSYPVVNSPTRSAQPRTAREHVIEFSEPPAEATYLDAVSRSLQDLRDSARVLVLSMGYDTVAGDPHGCWNFSSQIFTEIGRLLSASQLPICVVQEGGYALDSLTDCSHAFAIGLLGADQA